MSVPLCVTITVFQRSWQYQAVLTEQFTLIKFRLYIIGSCVVWITKKASFFNGNNLYGFLSYKNYAFHEAVSFKFCVILTLL